MASADARPAARSSSSQRWPNGRSPARRKTELFPASLEVGLAAIYEFALHPDFNPGDQRDRYSLELVIDCAEAF